MKFQIFSLTHIKKIIFLSNCSANKSQESNCHGEKLTHSKNFFKFRFPLNHFFLWVETVWIVFETNDFLCAFKNFTYEKSESNKLEFFCIIIYSLLLDFLFFIPIEFQILFWRQCCILMKLVEEVCFFGWFLIIR